MAGSHELPKGRRADYDRQLRNVYAMFSYQDANATLEKIFRQVERFNPSVAPLLAECCAATR